MICFDLFSIRLSQSHDSGHKFCRLTRVFLLCPFYIDFFFQFHSSIMC
jgi:hypothetical protein